MKEVFFAKELNLLTHPCKELIYYFIPRPKMGSGCKKGGGVGGGGRSGGRGSLMVIGVEQGKGGGRRGPKAQNLYIYRIEVYCTKLSECTKCPGGVHI